MNTIAIVIALDGLAIVMMLGFILMAIKSK